MSVAGRGRRFPEQATSIDRGGRALNILSIQSSVAYGHVGNSAAVFTLQRLGFEVWAVNTVALSNHPGHGGWRGHFATPASVAEIVRGLDDRGVLARCDAVLTGYLGDPGMGEVAIDAILRVRAANRDVRVCCDPVMGDAGRGFFVRPGIPEFFRERALAHADIVVPNAFELEFLAGRSCAGVEEALVAADIVRALGPGLVVVTGLAPGPGRIATLAVGADGAWIVDTPFVDGPKNGAGDLFSALFLGHALRTADTAAALAGAVSATHAMMGASAAAGSMELTLIAAQNLLVEPKFLFKAERLR